ncbi:MAG: membrane protein insertion efficiency factor YidD [Actinomycetota bacterium]|nr:MAG: membrane protein insertion efficiency factor YidD [Actinomycetota bacterium]
MGRAVTAVLVGLIRLYRLVLSPLLGARCRWYPSCSAYALGALTTHGAVKGSLLAGWRLCRCHPWTPGGLDPVPPRGRWRADIEPDGRPRHRPPGDGHSGGCATMSRTTATTAGSAPATATRPPTRTTADDQPVPATEEHE